LKALLHEPKGMNHTATLVWFHYLFVKNGVLSIT